MARFLITLLGSSKQNCDWHIFTVSVLFVRKRFIKIYLSQSQEKSVWKCAISWFWRKIFGNELVVFSFQRLSPQLNPLSEVLYPPLVVSAWLRWVSVVFSPSVSQRWY